MSMQKCFLINWSNLFYPTPLPPFLFFFLPISISRLFIHLSIYPLICPPVRLPIQLYISPYVYMPIYILHPPLSFLPPSLSPSPCNTTNAIFKWESHMWFVL